MYEEGAKRLESLLATPPSHKTAPRLRSTRRVPFPSGLNIIYLAGYIEIANLLNLLEKKSQKKNPAHHSVKKLTTRVRAVLLPRLC